MWNNAIIFIMQKEGRIADLQTYGPIIPLTQIIFIMLTKNNAQLINDFDQRYGTNDYFQVIMTLMETTDE